MGGAIGNVFDSVTDVFEDIVDVVSKAAEEIVDVVEAVAQFAINVHVGVVENAVAMVSGAIQGDWTQFRDAGLSTVTTAVAIAAIVVGGFLTLFGIPIGPLILAAGIITLDAQHNDGKLLSRVINYAAELEKVTLKSNYIEEYASEIQMLITTAAIVGASIYGGGYLSDISGVSSAMASWSTQIAVLNASYGTYQIYMAIQSIKNSQAYWEEKLREAEEYYRKVIAQAQAAKDQWFDMMTNPDMINRIQAGGDLFNMGAGHDLFSVTNVAEPRYALGLIDKSDPEMDRLMNNRYFAQYAGNYAFKPQ
jgi:hypothetical protein